MKQPVTFVSSKSWFVRLAIWGTCLLLVVAFGRQLVEASFWGAKVALGIFFLLLLGLLLWTWFGTRYTIIGNHLYYRCGPLHGRIPIQEIRIVKAKERLWSGLRPALGLDGLVVHYNKWDEIYLSPADKDGFVKALQAVNPQIVITE